MIKTLIDYDLTGHAYDADNPTREAEKLCYKLNTILDNLKADGAEIRMIESTDVTDAETYISELFDDYLTPPETAPEVETPTNEDMLLDSNLYSIINNARLEWLRPVADKVATSEDGTELQQLIEVQKALLTQETMLYLSDGTPLYGKTGAVA
jgi:hypothetical protein